MSGRFPPSKPDWSDLSVIHRGTLAPRSHFAIHDSESSALSFDIFKSANVLKLSGTQWKFHHANSPFSAPVGFESPRFDCSKWNEIPVPSMWQLHGYGYPHYTNMNFPFPVDPPDVPANNNQTGSYLRKFTTPQKFAAHQLRLRFEGVDSAFHVWVNGVKVGYSQGSRNPAEFDITSLVRADKENVLAVQVYQWCNGSYIEDQDQWRLSGIFRDVYIVASPEFRVDDFQVCTHLDEEYKDADLEVKLRIHGEGEISLKLLDSTGTAIAGVSESVSTGTSSLMLPILNPKKWTAETPNLYTLVLSFGDHYIVNRIGFRRIEMKNGIYTINGQRIVFRGVNRHEHHPRSGRTIPYDWLKKDLLLMKTHNINAIRTCHQPSHPDLYSLADELGFYVMDEADLECHGFASVEEARLTPEERALPFDKRMRLVNPKAAMYTSDNPDWEDAYVDRARQLVHRDKNHACVVMWSLGNESFYGRNHQKMYDAIRELDNSRPIHYEGDWDAETVDLYSRMYMPVDDCVAFCTGKLDSEPGSKNTSKPFVLCEFVHAMGNGPGNIKEYVEAFYENPRFQGGWVWEWANHGLLTKNEEGEEYYAYGGDFGDVPNDGNFVMDGLCFSNHTPTPGLTEYAKAIEPVQVFGTRSNVDTQIEVEIVNRYDIITLNHLQCHGSIIADGIVRPVGPIQIPSNIQPHQRAKLTIPSLDLNDIQSEAFLNLDFSLKHPTTWADQGHTVARSQLQIKPPSTRSLPPQSTPPNSQTPPPPPSVSSTNDTLTITSQTSKWTFSLPDGALKSWRKSDKDLLTSPMDLTISRPQTDNDRPQDGRVWRERLVHLATSHVKDVTWSTSESGLSTTVTMTSRIAPPVLAWSIDVTTAYTCHADGTLHVHVRGIPSGDYPVHIPRIGFTFSMPSVFGRVAWFGRGPGEGYRDKKLSQRVGNYTMGVDGLWTEYEFPQEGGNRTDVRWVRIGSDMDTDTDTNTNTNTGTGTRTGTGTGIDKGTSLTATFPYTNTVDGASNGGNFSVGHYDEADIEAARHPYELRKRRREDVVVRLDWAHHGLGTGSCGASTRREYALLLWEEGFEGEVLLG